MSNEIVIEQSFFGSDKRNDKLQAKQLSIAYTILKVGKLFKHTFAIAIKGA